MTKYRVTNGEKSTEFNSQSEADVYAASNGGTVSSFIEPDPPSVTVQQLTEYLDGRVFPFVKNLINSFAAENISMGITQAGKAGHVLALFSKYYPVPSLLLPCALKDSFDTGSLYVSLAVIQYIRDNPLEYDGLSPFVTDARLLKMKNQIELFLGVTPLST